MTCLGIFLFNERHLTTSGLIQPTEPFYPFRKTSQLPLGVGQLIKTSQCTFSRLLPAAFLPQFDIPYSSFSFQSKQALLCIENPTLEHICSFWYVKLAKYTAYSQHVEILSSSLLDTFLKEVNCNLKHSHSYVQVPHRDKYTIQSLGIFLFENHYNWLSFGFDQYRDNFFVSIHKANTDSSPIQLL